MDTSPQKEQSPILFHFGAVFLTGLLVLVLGFLGVSQYQQRLLIKAEESHIVFNRCSSFVDTGLKALIFPDGTCFVSRLSDPSERDSPRIRSIFKLPKAKRERILHAFQDASFFDQPKDLGPSATDGTSARFTLVTGAKTHSVRHSYPERNPLEDLEKTIVTLTTQYATKQGKVSLKEYLVALKTKLQALTQQGTVKIPGLKLWFMFDQQSVYPDDGLNKEREEIAELMPKIDEVSPY